MFWDLNRDGVIDPSGDENNEWSPGNLCGSYDSSNSHPVSRRDLEPFEIRR